MSAKLCPLSGSVIWGGSTRRGVGVDVGGDTGGLLRPVTSSSGGVAAATGAGCVHGPFSGEHPGRARGTAARAHLPIPALEEAAVGAVPVVTAVRRGGGQAVRGGGAGSLRARAWMGTWRRMTAACCHPRRAPRFPRLYWPAADVRPAAGFGSRQHGGDPHTRTRTTNGRSQDGSTHGPNHTNSAVLDTNISMSASSKRVDSGVDVTRSQRGSHRLCVQELS